MSVKIRRGKRFLENFFANLIVMGQYNILYFKKIKYFYYKNLKIETGPCETRRIFNKNHVK